MSLSVLPIATNSSGFRHVYDGFVTAVTVFPTVQKIREGLTAQPEPQTVDRTIAYQIGAALVQVLVHFFGSHLRECRSCDAISARHEFSFPTSCHTASHG
jgi:hypothetical protein